ncbi:hypothetical protein [Winogradskyella sp.]|uniref:hypothetical protein n=1 Tax=Winogradskyella sp. TaxID=1883156 RepID=UPI0025ED8931|nr:hypothetical protein [Winogradskyella sp.]MCT4629901.1 hypothetical protein [Winogradskyella sp.]
MNNNLAPTYQRLFGSYWVLWYKNSNVYSIVELDFKDLLDDYFESNSIDAFGKKLALVDSNVDYINIAKTLNSYLEQCHLEKDSFDKKTLHFESDDCAISKHYCANGRYFQVNYDTDLVQKTIHPAIAHLEVEALHASKIVFDIFLEGNQLVLLKNNTIITSVQKRNYHLLQGKFIMEMLSYIHNKKESDWLGTFHGSTITDGNNSILFIGESGKGKSTLSALLVAHGFALLADDVSPISSENSHIYYNPSAISIKKGAFNTLRPLIDDFDDIPNTFFNKTKGLLKYVPCKTPKKDSYPCKSIIMVNYKSSAETTLENVSIKKALETLIPDSWLSPNPTHAKQILDWLTQVNIYELTYSNTNNAIEEITTLFRKMKNN